MGSICCCFGRGRRHSGRRAALLPGGDAGGTATPTHAAGQAPHHARTSSKGGQERQGSFGELSSPLSAPSILSGGCLAFGGLWFSSGVIRPQPGLRQTGRPEASYRAEVPRHHLVRLQWVALAAWVQSTTAYGKTLALAAAALVSLGEGKRRAIVEAWPCPSACQFACNRASSEAPWRASRHAWRLL